MTWKFGKHRHAEHWIGVSTLLGLISSAYRDLCHWRSNQQPQKPKLYHRVTGPYQTYNMYDLKKKKIVVIEKVPSV